MYDDDGDQEYMQCSVCGGPLGLLGTLGTLDHYLCRNCGMQSSAPHAEPLIVGVLVDVSQDIFGGMILRRVDDGRKTYIQEDWAQDDTWVYLTPREDGVETISDAQREISHGWDVRCELDADLADVMEWTNQEVSQ